MMIKIKPGKLAHTQSAMIFQDSGAFSFRSYGLPPIKINSYINHIKKFKDVLTVYANMDVIGDAEATWENQYKMEDAGLTPIPIYHPISDDIKYLIRCIDNYDYFAIGGIAHNPSQSLRTRVLDNCWRYICDKNGYPTRKVHGFGLAAPSLMMRYPWFSVDTSSYMDYGQYGIILIPRKIYGKYNYDMPPVKVFITHRSPKKAEDGKHFESMTIAEQKAVLDYLKLKNIKLGISEFKKVEKGYKHQKGVEVYANKERTMIEVPRVEGVSNTNYYRDLINFYYYLDIAEQCPEYPWAFKPIKTNKLF